MSHPILQAEGLVKRFGAVRALDGLEITISEPGVMALLGPNGAGKTSFVNSALGLIRPASGSLRVFGKTPGSRAVRQRIGVMMQDAELPDRLTVRELIGLFASYYPNPLPSEEIIDRCELDGFATARFGRLSGGQKRRTQFALALVGNPDLIFLDEPTTGLDADARRRLWSNVRGAASAGATIILTTHYLEEADALADRVAVIDRGRIIADDTADALRAKVGGSVIRCATELDTPALSRLPEVRHVQRTGRFAELLVGDAVAALRSLIEASPGLSDLTVRPPSLEDAFEALIQPSAGAPS